MSFQLASHTFVTLIALQNGMLIETLCKMPRSRKITTAEIYTYFGAEKIRESMVDAESRYWPVEWGLQISIRVG